MNKNFAHGVLRRYENACGDADGAMKGLKTILRRKIHNAKTKSRI